MSEMIRESNSTPLRTELQIGHFIRLFEIKILHSRKYEFLEEIRFHTDLGIDPKFVFLYVTWKSHGRISSMRLVLV